jgi:predicted ATPase/DNA-binding SARP family transcriptional activator/tetratricopeptide (TPR) repeat protein
MAQLVLRLMGHFEASIAGKPITTFETNKSKALLAYLAAEADRVHTRDALAGMLWPDSPQSSAMQNLRHTLAALRKTIQDRGARPPYLLVTRQTVQINRESDLRVDQWDFEQVLPRQAGSSPEASIDSLEAAIRLFDGPFLDGFNCSSDLFDTWAQIRREGLNRQLQKARSRLAHRYAENGEHAASVRVARQMLELETGDEPAHRLVMRGLARLGERNAALSQFEACRRALRREYQVEPEPETQQLYEEIRRGQFEVGIVPGPAAFPDQPSIDRPPYEDLLAGWPALIGRERELEAIAERLDDPACRLLTLVGPGGIGKTHLALTAAEGQAGRFPQGIFFVSLASVQSVDAIAPAIAQGLGFSFFSGGEPIQQLLDYLEKRETLLLLDNFEHLLDGANLVADVLHAAPQVKILVTSRARLNLRAEFLFIVEGLDFPGAQFSRLDTCAAAQLFIEGARRVQPRSVVKEGEWKAIGQICRLVRGMPLALLLAASWMALLTPAQIAEEISRCSMEFLEAGWADTPERQRSMRTVFDYSFKLLSPREQEIFAGLAVFQGGFTLAAAREVTGVSLHELRALMDKSLVQCSSPGRYHLHELLRQYAQEILVRSPDWLEIVHDRHCAYFAAALAGWWKDLHGSRQLAAIAEFGVELENSLAAWDWMAEHIQVERMHLALLGLLQGLPNSYGELMGIEVGRCLCQKAVDRLAPLVLPAPTRCCDGARLLVKLWVSQPNLMFQLSDQTYALFQRGEALLRQLEEAGEDIRLEKAMLLRKMGWMFMESDRDEDFQAKYRECLALFRELNDEWMVANVLYSWGLLSALMGLQVEGLKMLEESIQVFLRLGDRIHMVDAMAATREMIWHINADHTALEHLVREYLAFCQGSGNARLTAIAKGDLGYLHFRQGRLAEACSELGESFTTLDQLGAISEASLYGLMLSDVQINMGQYEQAGTRCQAILPHFRKNNQLHFAGYGLFIFGYAALVSGQPEKARLYLEESVQLEPRRSYNDRGLGLAWLSITARALGQPVQAVANLVPALKIVSERHVVPAFFVSLLAAALIFLDWGEVERALEFYTMASRFSRLAKSALYEAAAGREVAARAAGLPEEVAAAARARGQARDFKSTVEWLLDEFGQIDS